MNLVQFKKNLFGGTWALNTTEIAVLMFITLQDRARFVFYKNKMMKALNIKDVRTLNKALNSLTAKGIIKQTIATAKGIFFSIIGLDEESETKDTPETISVAPVERYPEGEPDPKERDGGTIPRPFQEKESAQVPEPEFISVEVNEPQESRTAARFEHLTDVSEMEQDKQDALAVLMGRFAT